MTLAAPAAIPWSQQVDQARRLLTMTSWQLTSPPDRINGMQATMGEAMVANCR